MGRDTPSVGQPPAAFRKNVRSKKAKATLNKVIPALLTTHPRAKRGVDSSELIVQPRAQEPLDTSSREKSTSSSTPTSTDPQLKLRVTDTLTAAHELQFDPITQKRDSSNRNSRVGILNMASMLAPGGGFLNGASGQEASLCMRTTLLPSLKDEFYRLPEVGGIYTPDVLVFRDEQDNDLEKRDRYFIDCVSAGMLRFPTVTVDEATGRGSYTNSKDRDLVLEKMRAVMRVFQAKGVSTVVIGAWGCGAFGNPVGEIASAWKKVLLGGKQANRNKKGKREVWTGIEAVVFAIKDAGLAGAFGEAFGDGLLVEEAEDDPGQDNDDDDDGEAAKLRELQEKIADMRLRIQHARSPELKAGLSSILTGLEGQAPDKVPAEHVSAGGNTSDEASTDVDDSDSDSDRVYNSAEV